MLAVTVEIALCTDGPEGRYRTEADGLSDRRAIHQPQRHLAAAPAPGDVASAAGVEVVRAWGDPRADAGERATEVLERLIDANARPRDRAARSGVGNRKPRVDQSTFDPVDLGARQIGAGRAERRKG